MKRVLILIAAFLALGAKAQNEPPFSSVCLTSKSNGFNWQNGEWVHAKFIAETKYIAQKVDHTAYKDKPMRDQPLLCMFIEDKVQKGGRLMDESYRQACYAIRTAGQPSFLLADAEVCLERYAPTNELREVSCKKIKFSPNGLFIALPSDASMNLDKKPNNAYKDSIAVDIGECSKLH